MDTSSSQMSCVLRLDIQSRGWDKSMHKLFKGIRDVTYRIDAAMGLAYVTGKIRPEIILRIRKAKKHVQLIHINYGHNCPPRSLSKYYLPTITRFNSPPPTPMFHTAAQPYTYYRQIPYEQPRVAYYYFYHHR